MSLLSRPLQSSTRNVSAHASRRHTPREDRACPQDREVAVCWSVRAGSIADPHASAWIASHMIAPDAMLRLTLSLSTDDAAPQAKLTLDGPAMGAGEAAPLDLTAALLATTTPDATTPRIAGQPLLHITTTHDEDLNLTHVDATLAQHAILRATWNARGILRYAASSVLSILQVPGGRYELA